MKYPHTHAQLRNALAPFVAAGGWGCWRCGEPIPAGAEWDLGHDDLDPSIYRGPEHQRCNRATKGREPNGLPQVARAPSGRIAARVCEICGMQYIPRYSKQRTCGRACGAELQRRNRPVVEPKIKGKLVWQVHFLDCQHCGDLFTARSDSARYCGPDCRVEANRARARARYTPKQPRPRPSHFKCGHEATPENTYFNQAKAWRQCRICRRLKKAIERKRARAQLHVAA